MVTVEITKPGIYGLDGKPVAPGTKMELEREPTNWRGRYRVVSSDEGKTLEVATPDPAEEPEDEHDIGELRAQYEAKFGEEPDGRWGEKRLLKELAE